MQNFSFYIPTRLFFGKGELNRMATEKLPGKKAVIVTSGGTSMKKFGYLDRLTALLSQNDTAYVIFDKILPNPIKSHVMEGAALAKKEGCDFVIGLGGGSSIDSAKAIAVMATNEGDYWDYISGGSGKGQPIVSDPLPIIAITTTAGTGTEADPFTVTTKEETDEKIGFGCDKTFPFFSIIDPDLMMSVPAKLTAFQGFDALFHSTEGYIANIANPISDLFALKAIELIGKYLPRAVQNGSDGEARAYVALANTLAGMVESTSSCTSEHSIEHAMSGYHPELPHGAGLIMISAAYNTLFAQKVPERFVDMAKALGKTDAESPMDFVTALKDLQKACGVDALKMSDYGMKREELDKIATHAKNIMGGLFDLDRYAMTHEDIVSVLEQSYR